MQKGRERQGTPIQGGEEGFGRERMEAPSPVHHPSPARKPSPVREGGEEDGRGREVGGGGKMAGGCGQVAVIVIANPTVGPNGCRGWAI